MKNCLFTSLLLLALSGCGGSGGSSSDNTTPPTEPANTFSVTAINVDQCGNETADTTAELIIHNADLSTNSTINADANGVMSYQTDDATKSVSLVVKGTALASGSTPIRVLTYADQPMIAMGNSYNSISNDSCECIVSNFALSTPFVSNQGPSSASIQIGKTTRAKASINTSNSVVSFNNIEVCKTADGSWPTISATLTFENPDQSYAAVITDYVPGQDISAELTGQIIDFVGNGTRKQLSVVKNAEVILNRFNIANTAPVYIYPVDGVDSYALRAYNSETVNEEGNIIKFTSSTIKHTSNVQQSFDLTVPNFNPDDQSSYDMTDSSYIDALQFTTMMKNDNEQTVFTWIVMTPATNDLPDLSDYDLSGYVIDNISQSEIATVTVIIKSYAYQGINGYQDYRSKIVDRVQGNLVTAEWADEEQVVIRYTENVAGLTANSIITNAQQKLNILQ